MKSVNPIEKFKTALERAENSGITLPNAMSLATAGADGNPSVRMMLLKGADERGFIFYTNLQSRKARELQAHPHASLCFWWPALEEQVRVEGKIQSVSPEEADAYFSTRPDGSKLGAWASRQSEVLNSRKDLVNSVEEFQRLYEGQEIPRPPFWSGFIVVPDQIEFWYGKPDRLHERHLYLRQGTRWSAQQLYP